MAHGNTINQETLHSILHHVDYVALLRTFLKLWNN